MRLITGTKRATWRERRQRWLYLDRCIGLTRAERIGRAVLWMSLGSAIAMVMSAVGAALAPVPPVELLDPLVDHAGITYTVYRLRFEWRGTHKSCELIVFHDRKTWRLSCDPR